MAMEKESSNNQSGIFKFAYEFSDEYSNGEYKILYCTNPNSKDEKDTENVIQFIQGAEVRCNNVNLKSRINWIEGKQGQKGGGWIC